MMTEVGEATGQEDVRAGYQAAVSIWTYQGQLNWNRFNVMLVANSVIVAVISALMAGENRPPPLIVSLAVLGFFLCMAWVLVTARGFAYLTYWFWSAVELERRLGDGVETTSRLATLRKGGEVRFEVDGVGPLRLGFWSRTSQRVPAYATIAVFLVAYLGFAVAGMVIA